jgi:tetratricopeptide (TPR) repeat protein
MKIVIAFFLFLPTFAYAQQTSAQSAEKMVASQLWNAKGEPLIKKPHWSKVKRAAQKECGEACAARLILEAKIHWYDYYNDTAQILKYGLKKIAAYGIDTMGFAKIFFNNFVYYFVFEHCKKESVLERSAQWMQALIQSDGDNASFIDTYANLLYKLGNRDQALAWEKKAVELSHKDKEVIENYNKMMASKPSWGKAYL